ncbi:TonB-dependent receptor [Steroidobacter sp. S1-65]|uniref:TonB-dependent receptor n=1 Tax=Steroidobacter gossypii TaxID=2805490 RepID=A0ABS1X4U0_9GAMM|nr:TonB-dependent receptor [Steroidobacter gossypii]MBM0108235.1 TonB-dependent receptor [Steroidobacter gossypii]
MNDRSVLLRRAVVGALALMTVPAFGQQATEPQDSRTIDTIIVTAQKREQSLQDVPIVVTAVSEQLLQDTGVRDIKDLAILAPGLTVTSTSSEASTTARIRGIGTVGDNPGLESSVGVVIDGVYRPRNGVAFGDLGELERIEVLKGPQGTLFGKNTSAGVINVISKRPQFDFGSNVELTTGNFSALEGAASITGPLAGDTLAGRLFVSARERDGYYDVSRGEGPRTEDDDWDRSFYTARGQLLFRPTNNFEARIIADYTERDENCCGAVQMNTGPTALRVDALSDSDTGVGIPADPFEYDIFSNRPTTQQITDQGVSAELVFDIGELELTSITAWRNWEIVNGQDVDYSSADIFYREPGGPNFTEFDQLSQELRLAGQTGKMNWIIGGFFAAEDLDSRVQLLYGSDYEAYVSSRFAPSVLTTQAARVGWLAAQLGVPQGSVYPAGQGQLDTFAQEGKSYALFANNSIAFTEQLELTLGLRYTKEEKDLDSAYNNLGGGLGCARIRQNLAAPPTNPNSIAAQLTVFPTAPAAVNGLATFVGTACSTANDHAYTGVTTRQTSIDEDDLSGTAKLAFRVNEQVMTYVSYARGYKASGYNLDRTRLTPVQPSVITDTSFAEELVDSYELGIKTNLADNSLLLNTAVFYQDYQDFQLNTFTGIQFVVRSLPQVVSQGIDVDLVWYTPLDQLSLQGGVTYAETEIEDFGTTLGESGVFAANRENDRLSFAPKWSGSVSATYDQPIGANLLLRANVGAKYLSEYNTGSNLDPAKIQDAYTIVNARLGFGAADEKWMIEAWSLNVTDEEYVQVVFDAPAQTATYNAFLGAPRTYGLTARFKF